MEARTPLRLLIAPKGGREVPSSRYRVHDLLPLLRASRWETTLLTPSTHREQRLWNALVDAVTSARGADALLVQRPGRRREESALLRLAARRSRIVVVDVDDPVAERGAFAWAVARADVVLAGSRALVRAYEPRVRRVVYLPTPLDVALYDRPKQLRERPVVGWIGDGPAYAEPLLRMLAAIAPVGAGWQLRIVGTKSDRALEEEIVRASRAPIELVGNIDWQNEEIVAETVAQFDVGLAPLRSKEGASFKTVQYLAAGVIPVVEMGGEAEEHARASLGSDAPVVPVGDGAALQSALRTLANPDFRARLSSRAKDAAAKLYSREVAATVIDTSLREALLESHT